MTHEELVYLAGFFDGEGCIHIQTRRDGRWLNLLVSIVQTNPRPLLLAHSEFGGSLSKTDKSSGKSKKPIWRLCFAPKNAARFLRAVYPYLIVKKEEAEVALAFVDTIPYPHTRDAVCDEVIALRQSLAKKCQDLKRTEYYSVPDVPWKQRTVQDAVHEALDEFRDWS